MKSIIQIVEEATQTGKRLLEENPGLSSVAFAFDGFSPDEVREAGAQLDSYIEYSRVLSCVIMVHCPITSIAIHIRSKKLKLIEVEEVEENNLFI